MRSRLVALGPKAIFEQFKLWSAGARSAREIGRIKATCAVTLVAKMPTRADEYRSRAEEAEAVARIETNEQLRSEWEAVARQWRELARQAEQHRT